MHTANYFENPEQTEVCGAENVLAAQVKEENASETTSTDSEELKYDTLIPFKKSSG